MKTENLSKEDLSIPLETNETPEPMVPVTEPEIPEGATNDKKPEIPTVKTTNGNEGPEEDGSTFSCRESIHIDDLAKEGELELEKEKDEDDTKIEEEGSPKVDEDKGMRNRVYLMLEYFLGFVLGLTFNLLSYTILNYMSKKERKRKGIFVGCMVSFALIFLICLSYMSYTRQTLIAEREWAQEHNSFKGLHIPSFWKYLTGQVGNHYRIAARPKKKSRSLYNKKGSLLTAKNKKRKKKEKKKYRKSVPVQISRAERRRMERERLIASLNRSAIEYQKHLKELL